MSGGASDVGAALVCDNVGLGIARGNECGMKFDGETDDGDRCGCGDGDGAGLTVCSSASAAVNKDVLRLDDDALTSIGAVVGVRARDERR